MVSGKESKLFITLVLLLAVPAVSVASTSNDYTNFTSMIDAGIFYSPAVLIESLYAGSEIFHPHTAVFMFSIGLLCISFIIDLRLFPSTLKDRLCPNQAGFYSNQQFTPNIPQQYLPEKLLLNKFQQELNINSIPNIIKSHFSSLFKPALIYVAPRAEQKITFSPGFIFVRLPRGPPNLT